MENRKWLKRKYPESFKEVDAFLDDQNLEYVKKNKFKIGRLVKNKTYVGFYPKGTMIYFKKSNPIRNENHPMHYAVAKCKVGFTESSYHSFDVFDEDFEEIKK